MSGLGSPNLARGWGGNVPGVSAFYLRALPGLNLLRLVHFSEIECRATNRTHARRHTRCIKFAISKIRIAVAGAEDAMTVAPFTPVERSSFMRCGLVKHDSSHRTMVQIAERGEFRLGMASPWFLPGGKFQVPIGIERAPGSKPPESEPRSTAQAGRFRVAKRTGKIRRVEFNTIGNQLLCGLRKRCPLRE